MIKSYTRWCLNERKKSHEATDAFFRGVVETVRVVLGLVIVAGVVVFFFGVIPVVLWSVHPALTLGYFLFIMTARIF